MNLHRLIHVHKGLNMLKKEIISEGSELLANADLESFKSFFRLHCKYAPEESLDTFEKLVNSANCSRAVKLWERYSKIYDPAETVRTVFVKFFWKLVIISTFVTMIILLVRTC